LIIFPAESVYIAIMYDVPTVIAHHRPLLIRGAACMHLAKQVTGTFTAYYCTDLFRAAVFLQFAVLAPNSGNWPLLSFLDYYAPNSKLSLLFGVACCHKAQHKKPP